MLLNFYKEYFFCYSKLLHSFCFGLKFRSLLASTFRQGLEPPFLQSYFRPSINDTLDSLLATILAALLNTSGVQWGLSLLTSQNLNISLLYENSGNCAQLLCPGSYSCLTSEIFVHPIHEQLVFNQSFREIPKLVVLPKFVD